MEEALIAFLNSYAPLKALARAIAWRELPRAGRTPAVALWWVSGGPSYTYKGVDALQGALIQFDCWGATGEECLALTRAVMDAVHRHEQGFDIFITTRRDSWSKGDAPRDDGAVNLFRTSLDCRVWFKPGT